MNYQEMLDAADYNRSKAKREADLKRYTSELPPPKKPPKATVQSDGIKKFLEKKKAEEEARLAEARKQKEKLLELRAQNSKNNKKAKIMASRTKDNDFSRIKLTEDEVISKKKIESELIRKRLGDKVERMKARIELEEKEKMLPKKRKRKSKIGNEDDCDDPHFSKERLQERDRESRHDSSKDKDKSSVKKAPRPPPPVMSFSELLKVAEAKQHEPVVIPQKKTEEEKLMTKKQRRLEEQEQERIRRKLERDMPGPKSSNFSKPSSSSKPSLSNGKSTSKPPPVQKKGTPCVAQNFKASKESGNPVNKNVPLQKTIEKSNKIPPPKEASRSFTNHDRQAPSRSSEQNDRQQMKQKPKETKPVFNTKKPMNFAKPFVGNGQSAPAPAAKPAPVMPVDTDAIAAAIEKRIREKLEKEIEEKLAAKFAAKLQGAPTKVKPPGFVNGSSSKRPVEKMKPEKKPFHPNPYLDPPKRRLEPIRPQKPIVKRRIEDDSDEDDMSDFIDDGPSQNDEDYSKYIQEIFGYDKRKYVDDDDDDIVETSFGEQLKEETRSARLGYLEDLEEERLERQREMEKMKRKKLKK